MVFGVLILGLIVAAVVAVLRSEHTTAAKAAMLLLTFLVPILGAIFALALAARELEHLHSPDSSHQ